MSKWNNFSVFDSNVFFFRLPATAAAMASLASARTFTLNYSLAILLVPVSRPSIVPYDRSSPTESENKNVIKKSAAARI
jgi:hypothetical protein